jgi:CRISPR-associated protein Cmr6
MKNAGYLFYKKYYSDDGKSVKVNSNINRDLEELKIDETFTYYSTFSNLKSFELKTIYPGLLIGSGYSHDVEDKESGGYKLGFYFDHTTGLPVIPGSSVKGLLRAYMEEEDYFNYLLKFNNINKSLSAKNVVNAIFEGELNGKIIPMSKRDIFLEAYPLKSGNKFLGSDYITPHKDPLKNPVPIKFLKVLPDVKFKFNFILQDDIYLSADEKLKLFKTILLDIGIGAKTNVGYGKFVECQVCI